MKLSDIKGRRSLAIMGLAMELVDRMDANGHLGAMLEEMGGLGGDSSGAWRIMCKHLPPVLADEKCCDMLIELLALANDVPAEEYAESGDVIGDLFALVMSDWDSIGFLSRQGHTEM